MGAVNWDKIKNEYITTNIGQRPLAAKHKVSFNTLKTRANKEKWADQRKEYNNKVTIKTQQKLELIAEQQADRNTRHLQIWDKLLDKIEVVLHKPILPEDITRVATAIEKAQRGQRLAEGLDKAVESSVDNSDAIDEFIRATKPDSVYVAKIFEGEDNGEKEEAD
jgi:hypothetical protein